LATALCSLLEFGRENYLSTLIFKEQSPEAPASEIKPLIYLNIAMNYYLMTGP